MIGDQSNSLIMCRTFGDDSIGIVVRPVGNNDDFNGVFRVTGFKNVLNPLPNIDFFIF